MPPFCSVACRFTCSLSSEAHTVSRNFQVSMENFSELTNPSNLHCIFSSSRKETFFLSKCVWSFVTRSYNFADAGDSNSEKDGYIIDPPLWFYLHQSAKQINPVKVGKEDLHSSSYWTKMWRYKAESYQEAFSDDLIKSGERWVDRGSTNENYCFLDFKTVIFVLAQFADSMIFRRFHKNLLGC